MKDFMQRFAIALIGVIAYLTGVIPPEVTLANVSLTAIQWLGLLGVVATGYLSPSKVKAAVGLVK